MASAAAGPQLLLGGRHSSIDGASSPSSSSAPEKAACALPSFAGLRPTPKLRSRWRAEAAAPAAGARRGLTSMAASESEERAEEEEEEDKAAVGRRDVILSLGALAGAAAWAGNAERAEAEEELMDWERIPLPVDSGVVLADLAFLPEDPDHGFLLGTRQTLLETKDGGRSWIPRSVPVGEDEFNFRLTSISFLGKEGWIVGKPAILLHTTDAGATWSRVPLSARLPGNPVVIQATGERSAEMVTDEGAIYVTGNDGANWKAAVAETVSATLNRTVSSGISGASYYNGSFNGVNRSSDGEYVAVSSRGNFYLTWEPGQPYWQPHNRTSARRIQNMGWRADGGLWMVVRGGGLFFSKGKGISEDYEESKITSRGFGILDVGYRTPSEAWAVGGSGTLLRTLDGGKTWVRDKAADNIGANLYSVKFVGPRKGFIIGNNGVLLRYLG